MLLAELVHQVVEVADLLQRAGRLAVPEIAAAADPLAPAPVQVGSQRPQVVAERGHLARQRAVAERLAHQPSQFRLLLRGERAHQPLPGGGPAGQRVDQLVDVGRLLREEVAVLAA